MSHDFWITIDGDRGDEWERVAGTRRFPIRSPIPRLAVLPGIGEARVYLLALDAVDDSTKQKIIEHLASKFGLTADESQAEIVAGGIPILETDCTVIIQNQQRWL